jgi:hypothetical protein
MGQPMTARKDPVSEKLLGLHWLIRLRWIAVLGQTLACFAVALLLGFKLPVPVLVACIGFTAVSNALLVWHRKRSGGGKAG